MNYYFDKKVKRQIAERQGQFFNNTSLHLGVTFAPRGIVHNFVNSLTFRRTKGGTEDLHEKGPTSPLGVKTGLVIPVRHD
jgi:hypothetical protein